MEKNDRPENRLQQSSWARRQSSQLAFLGIDLLLVIAAAVYFAGGINWESKLRLSHGADLRRLALGIGLLSFWFVPKWREESHVLSLARWGVRQLKSSGGRSAFLGGGLILLLGVSVLQFLALRAPLWDIGLFHQIIWNIKNGNGFESTVSGAGEFLKDHLSPSLALLVPLSGLLSVLGVPEPLLLAIAHPLLLWGGVLAWVLLAARTSPTLAAAACLFVFSFESLWKNLGWGFHENAVAFCASSWAFALLFWDEIPTRFSWRAALILLLLLITALSKEILLLDVALLSLVWAFWVLRSGTSKEGRVPLFLSLFGLSVSHFLIFVLFERMDHPADKNYFLRYYSYLGRDLSEFFKTLFLSPWVVVRQVGFLELARYIWNVFSPWLFIPIWGPFFLYSRSLRRECFWSASFLLAIVPSFASAALSTYFALRRPDFHYVLELWPVLAALTLLMLGWIGSNKLIWAWVFVSVLRWDYDPVQSIREYSKQLGAASEVRKALAVLPPKATLMADDLAGPWVAGRRQVTRLPDRFFLGGACPDAFVVEEHLQQARTSKLASVDRVMDRDLLSCPAFQKSPVFRANGWAIYTHSP